VGLDQKSSWCLADINLSYSLTVFSPSGKLVQIEHALAAVSQGTTSLGIKGASQLSLVMVMGTHIYPP
jgi:20S proteasome subunit alpha 2